MRRPLTASLLVVALVGGLAACAPGAPMPTQAPTVKAESTPTPQPVETQTPITCETLVPDVSREGMEAAGWSLFDGYVEKMRSEESSILAFADYGGGLCLWGPPNGHGMIFAASAIDATQEAAQRARLEAEGFTKSEHNGADLYERSDEIGGVYAYLFVEGYWFLASSVEEVDRVRQTLDVS
jgi:hypothetical protein